MRRNALSLLLFLFAFAAVVGCTDTRFKHAAKHKEECILPPDDPRMNNPPTAEYRARVKNSEDKSTLMNASKQMGSGMGGGANGRGGF